MKAIYRLRQTLKSHGMPPNEVQEIFRSVVISSLLYAAPAWWGFASEEDKARLNSFLKRSIKSGFYSASSPTIPDLVSTNEVTLFNSIQSNPQHVLHNLLPHRTTHSYSLRPRAHPYCLPQKTSNLATRNFLMSLMYKDMY